MNCAWTLAPWADLLYASDPKWWRAGGQLYGQRALAEFEGVKVCQDAAFCESEPRVRHIRLRHENDLVTDPGEIGSGQNSGFQAFNLAFHTGARRILLLGFDMHGEGRLHFHRDHSEPLGNPDQYTPARWRSAFNAAESKLKGIDVLNCTPGSRLGMFPRMGLEEALCAPR